MSRQTRHFLKGPIPWWWLQRASALPGQALLVGLALWLWAGMRNTSTVRLSVRSFPADASRFAVYRGLRALEDGGLVTVQRRKGYVPVVTIRTTFRPARRRRTRRTSTRSELGKEFLGEV